MNNKLKDRLSKVDPMTREAILESDQIADLVDFRLKELGWSKGKLAEEIGAKNQSVITRYLSGQHNFTIKTIRKLELALGIKIMHIGEPEVRTLIIKSAIPQDTDIYFGSIFTNGETFSFNMPVGKC